MSPEEGGFSFLRSGIPVTPELRSLLGDIGLKVGNGMVLDPVITPGRRRKELRFLIIRRTRSPSGSADRLPGPAPA